MTTINRNFPNIEIQAEGHNPRKKGYQPSTGKIDPKNPPKDGSGLKKGQNQTDSKKKTKS